MKARGLFTDSNQLGSVPEGAMTVADNVIIDRDDIVESRRGFSQFGNTFGTSSDRANQLISYKDRVLVHNNNTLLYNDNSHENNADGNFQAFSGTFSEIEDGRRIRAFESNKNLYFTTDDGVKKISAKTAADFTTAADFIIDSGAAKALDVTGDLVSNADGYLPPSSEVAYRIVWGYKDNNDNLLLGSPSSRLVISNFTQANANVNLSFVIPDNVDTSIYFYQVYRTAVFTTVGSLTVEDIDPGDEMQLVIEDFVTTSVPGDIVSVEDIAPEDFRSGGTFLYTNPNSGDGIDQANEPPPKAKDITMYQSTLFYGNTIGRARKDLGLLTVQGLVSGTSSITIDDTINPAQVYTFQGGKEITELEYSAYSGAIPADLDGKYCLVNSAGDKRKYYVWYDDTKTTQTLDFTNYVGVIADDVEGKVIVLYTPDTSVTYYVWFDKGGTIDPGTLSGTPLLGMIGIRVDVSTISINAPNTTLIEELADLTAQAIVLNDINSDFDVTHTAPATIITVDSESIDSSRLISLEDLQKGFSYTAITPVNSDPANDIVTHTDVVGRTGFKVNVSRGVTTVAQVADATAAAILDQDTAADFDVAYTAASTLVTLTTTNNGDTTDAVDSAIAGIANSFTVTVTQQGIGEDSSTNKVLLSAAASPSQQIDETARSLVNIINRNSSGTVYAFYISGASDLPGLILFESRDIGINQFTITANNAATGDVFNPALPPSVGAQTFSGETETKPNRVYYAKLQQPEAVPLLNFIDIGPEDKEIQRILALRESLFILKDDGIYRLTGSNGVYAVDLFDESTKIIAPDTAVVLNNQIYCLTNQGIAIISDTGVNIISKDIDDIVKLVSSSGYDFKFNSFGVSYETDRSYLLWLPSSETDTVATQCLRYSTVTNSFTIFTIAKTCGIVNQSNDKLYLGPDDENFIEQERKLFDRTDYADRDFALSIPTDSIADTTLKLSSSSNVDVGDAVVQTQYLTISEFNQLLSRLDLDPGTGAPEQTSYDFTSYTGSILDLHSKYYILYSAADNTKYAVFYDAIGTLTELDTLIFNDIADAVQVRVDVTTAVTTSDVALFTKNTLSTTSLEFITSNTGPLVETVTTRNGDTTDAFDGVLNGIGNGFVITVTSQGFGDFLGNLQATPGVNLTQQLNSLAQSLDLDPGVSDTDYLTSITPGSAVGSTVTLGTPTVITEVGHLLETGRFITISNSTSTPVIDGNYIVTKVDANNFSIDITTTVGGTCDWAANVSTFEETQAAFNTVINKLNLDAGVFYQNYDGSTGSSEEEVLIVGKENNVTDVVMQYSTQFIEGPITLYKGINCDVVYSADPLGDPSISKHVREGTFIFENNNFSRATVGYASDLSPGFQTIDFTKSGKGDWGLFIWGEHNWGGGFSGVPLRTYIPRQKQRCRFIKAEFIFNSAREKFALYGITYTFRPISEKAWT